MTDEEIIKKILEIKLKEGLNMRELSPSLNISMRLLSDILNNKAEITEARRRIFEMIFDLYDKGKVDFYRITYREKK